MVNVILKRQELHRTNRQLVITVLELITIRRWQSPSSGRENS